MKKCSTHCQPIESRSLLKLKIMFNDPNWNKRILTLYVSLKSLVDSHVSTQKMFSYLGSWEMSTDSRICCWISSLVLIWRCAHAQMEHLRRLVYPSFSLDLCTSRLFLGMAPILLWTWDRHFFFFFFVNAILASPCFRHQTDLCERVDSCFSIVFMSSDSLSHWSVLFLLLARQCSSLLILTQSSCVASFETQWNISPISYQWDRLNIVHCSLSSALETSVRRVGRSISARTMVLHGTFT